MEQFRWRPCQPALPPAQPLAKTEGEHLPTAEKNWSKELSGGETYVMQGKKTGVCFSKEGRTEAYRKKERGILWKLTALHSHVQAVWLPTATRHDVIGS